MSELSPIDVLKAGVPSTVDRAIFIYPTPDDQTACRWFGLSKQQVASHLYQIADQIVAELPPVVDMQGRKLG